MCNRNNLDDFVGPIIMLFGLTILLISLLNLIRL